MDEWGGYGVLTCQGSVRSLEKHWRREAVESPWSAQHLSAFGWVSEPGGKFCSRIWQDSKERSPGQSHGRSGFNKSQVALKTLLLKVNRGHLVLTNTLLSMRISPESWLVNVQRQEHGEERWWGEAEWVRERRKRKNREKEGGEERGILSALGWVAQRQQKHSGIYSKVPLSMLTACSGERGWSWREENLLFFLSSLVFSAVSLISKNRHQIS